MTKQGLVFLSFLFFYHFTITSTLALSPAQAPSQTLAQAPAKPPTSTQPAVEPPSEVPLVQAPPHRARAAPTNAGGFSVFIRLLKSTSVSIQIENQLNVSNSLTIFAPTNGAFSALKPGTLNSLSTEEKVQLVQYHILPSFISLQNFQTLSNPVRTQASNTYDFPLNITVEGSWVNISTGIVNTTISATIYEDNQLAIYKVDKVLLPLGIFAPRPKLRLAPSPSPVKPSSSSSALDSPVAALDASNALSRTINGLARAIGGVVLVASTFFMGSL
ncbi:FAS1 domain containing protein [Trema orientale]|uniref:FAS1 domain containing protein n=1 Tax=Trema orientale TaxID=63057 RepID=A0A2P5E4B1_TREOI|nr:FAS1 domain containing protein [Trema orientale]